MFYKIQPKTNKMNSNGFACDFWLPCFAILKLKTDKSMKTEKTLKHLHYQPNLIKSSGLGTNSEDWPSLIDFDKVLQDLTTLFSQFDRLIVTIRYKQKYFITFYQFNGQILDLSLSHDDRHMSLYLPTVKLWLISFT